ncbi:hypothetical protein ACFL4G_04540 [Thermodesulfobacteriota bacterium]
MAMVCSQDTSLKSLAALKERAKQILKRAKTEQERGAATILYHSAIAAGYGLYGRNLSSRPIEKRLDLYEDLATAIGEDPFGRVFRRAVEQRIRK